MKVRVNRCTINKNLLILVLPIFRDKTYEEIALHLELGLTLVPNMTKQAHK